MTPAQSLALWADQLRDISAAGLQFSKDIYDLENYQAIQNIAMEMFALATGEPLEKIEPLRGSILSRRTPLSIGDGAVINDNGEILLIQRAGSRRWALPGGALAVCETPAEGVRREVLEETGVNCEPIALVGVYDSRLGEAPAPQHQYNFVFLCKPLICEALKAPSHALEVLDMGWFTEQSLPSPLEPSNVRRIRDAFNAWRSDRRAYFDRINIVDS